MKYSAILLGSVALFPLATPALAQDAAAKGDQLTTEIVVTAQKSSEKIS